MRLFFKRVTVEGVHFVEYVCEDRGSLRIPYGFQGTHILRAGTDDAAVNYARLRGWQGSRALAHNSEIGQMILKGQWVEQPIVADEDA